MERSTLLRSILLSPVHTSPSPDEVRKVGGAQPYQVLSQLVSSFQAKHAQTVQGLFGSFGLAWGKILGV